MRPRPRRKDSVALAAIEWPLLENSSVAAAIVVSMEGAVLGANARMRKLIGVAAPADLAGTAIHDVLAGPDDWSGWQQARGTGMPVSFRLKAKDGSTVALRGDVRPVTFSGTRALCGVFIDAGDEHQVRASMQKTARMEALGSLTIGIAHDFNNLLTVLIGNLYLVVEELRDRPKAFDKLKAARDAAKRGADLVKQLLSFARREEVAPDVIDPCKVIADIAPLLRRALGARIVLETYLDPHAGRIRASIAQLESVVVNLAINARDAIAGKGVIKISAKREQISKTDAALSGLPGPGDYLVVSVADDGHGIPEETIPRVFEPFFSTKTDRGGTGLGLSMVRWFAEQAGGAASIRSAVRQGTVVMLFLPSSADVTQDTHEGTMPLSTLPTGTERVVVLALDDEMRSTIRRILEVLGYAVSFTASEDETLAALRAEPADLVIVDGLARDDREWVARAKDVSPGLKVIVTTEGARAADVAPASGVALLAKPFTLADLAGSVRRALDAPPGG
jgi:signal transduction histidine kinase